MISDVLRKAIAEALTGLGLEDAASAAPADFSVEHPDDLSHGDYATNAALVLAKRLKANPRELAEKLVAALSEKNAQKKLADVERIGIAGPGFINFHLKREFFAKQVQNIIDKNYNFFTEIGFFRKKVVMVEYTDPNPFKVFHIGHLMANAIGESISRLVEYNGSKVIRACYQGDVGLHVAKTIWAVKTQKLAEFNRISDLQSLQEKVKFLGECYLIGNAAYEDVEDNQKKDFPNLVLSDSQKNEYREEIQIINKEIFEKKDQTINSIYEKGREWSLEYFDLIYKRLGTKFNEFYFESEVAEDGIKIVKSFLNKGVFAQSDGAIVFKGEEHNLHTRVFINSKGLPTYETKEIGLNSKKFKEHRNLSKSIIVTANEQSDYFKVLLKVLSLIDPNIASKTRHISHGILRFAVGKMSSRLGNIIPAEVLIDRVKQEAKSKMANENFKPEELDEISDQIAIAAIKYTILRQANNSDVIFDPAKSLSFEGDSGPYLQYAVVRAKSVMIKAKSEGVAPYTKIFPKETYPIEKIMYRFPEIAEIATKELEPHRMTTYLTELAGSFNSFYANNQIVAKGNDNHDSNYKVAITDSFIRVMEKGLYLLGISVPDKM